MSGDGMRNTLILSVIAGGLLAAAPAGAQTASVDGRLTQLEKRMNTVERVVSKAGGSVIQPEIGPNSTIVTPDGAPASSALADLQTRIASIERELSGFTGRLETAEHKVQQLEADLAAYRRSTDARLAALEKTAPAPGIDDPVVAPPKPAPKPGVGTTTPKPAADPDRAARLAAVVKPTGKDALDKGMYAYNYGYRLWQGGFYPEAETQLQGYAGKYTGHRLTSRAQHLLGVVYMDDGKPNLAAQIFFENYSKLPDGERASDSLLSLGKALTQLKKPKADICRVYTELNQVYGAKLTAAQKAEAIKGRAAAKCP